MTMGWPQIIVLILVFLDFCVALAMREPRGNFNAGMNLFDKAILIAILCGAGFFEAARRSASRFELGDRASGFERHPRGRTAGSQPTVETPVKDANARTYSLPSLSNSAVFTAGVLGRSFPRCAGRVASAEQATGRMMAPVSSPASFLPGARVFPDAPTCRVLAAFSSIVDPYACQQSVRDIYRSTPPPKQLLR